MLVAFAFVFVFQDSLFWLSIRKFEDFLQSEGLEPAELAGAESRIKALKDYSRRIWWMTFVFRLIALVTGVVLTYSELKSAPRVAIGLVGYAAVFVGLSMALKTNMLYWHADEEYSKRLVRSREKRARDAEATAIHSNNPDWRSDPSLAKYRRE